jgi:acetyl-CoA C-acetyltransferase
MSAYLFDAVRTPRGKGKNTGSLHAVRPVRLASETLKALQIRNNLDTSQVEDVILGCVTPVGEQGGNIAKLVAQYSGYPSSVAGFTLNRFCASGLEAVNLAAAQIMSGTCDLVVAGGVESMSRIPMMSDGGAWMTDPEVFDKTLFVPQGISADLLASMNGISRKEADQFAVESQKRAATAWEQGRFKKSIVPLRDISGEIVLDRDEHIRPGATVEELGGLKPSFQEMGEKYGFDPVALQRYPAVEKIEHIHHAGNSSGIVDGAAAVLLGSKEAGSKLGLKPRAKIKAMAVVSTEPTLMLTGPVPATQKVLQKAKMKISDIDLFEINEAFAAVVIYAMRELGISQDKVNVNGGAIALGHPLGATGAMLVGTVVDELERQNKSTGLVTLCVGGGMGVATIIERV